MFWKTENDRKTMYFILPLVLLGGFRLYHTFFVTFWKLSQYTQSLIYFFVPLYQVHGFGEKNVINTYKTWYDVFLCPILPNPWFGKKRHKDLYNKVWYISLSHFTQSMVLDKKRHKNLNYMVLYGAKPAKNILPW